MTTATMREIIAERLARHYVEGGPWDGFMEADIVLDALMEPTEEMRSVGMDHLLSNGDIYSQDGDQVVIETHVTISFWRAMLRAAKEGK